MKEKLSIHILVGVLALVLLPQCVLEDGLEEAELGSIQSELVWQSSGGFESGIGLPATWKQGDASTPWRTTGVHHNGSYALGCRTLDDTNGIKERSEVVIATPNEPGHLNFTKVRYIGMAIYPHEDSDDNTEPGVILRIRSANPVAQNPL